MHYIQVGLTVIVVLSVLVVVHEWGHFIMARLCGMQVDEFSIGFGPLAAKVGRLGNTDYNIRWVPLGGFVRIAGMEPDEEPFVRAGEKARRALGSKAEDRGSHDIPLIAENPVDSETLAAADGRQTVPNGFYSKPLWQRALVIFAGPFMSFVLGYVVLCTVGFTVPNQIPTNAVHSVLPGSEAQKIGLKAGDAIVSINGRPFTSKTGDQLVELIHSSTGRKLTLLIRRGATEITLIGVPQPDKNDPGIGVLGFVPVSVLERVSVAESIQDGNNITVAWLQGMGHLVASHNLTAIKASAGGPVYIVEVTNEAVKYGIGSVLLMLGQLSLSLAIFNMLPIPILDGGHLLLFAIEALRRGKKLTLEQQQNFMLAGLAIIGVLFVLILFNDFTRRHLPQ